MKLYPKMVQILYILQNNSKYILQFHCFKAMAILERKPRLISVVWWYPSTRVFESRRPSRKIHSVLWYSKCSGFSFIDMSHWRQNLPEIYWCMMIKSSYKYPCCSICSKAEMFFKKLLVHVKQYRKLSELHLQHRPHN